MKWATMTVWWSTVVAAMMVGGCGGGSGTAPQTSSLIASRADAGAPTGTRVRAQAAADSTPTQGPINDKNQWPEVVHLEQVASTRVDRTQYDYTFALHVRGSGIDITNGQLNLRAVGEGSTVRDGAAAFVSLNAGRYQVLADTITIRHDRTKPFDASKIAFDFTGTIATQATTGASAPRIASVSFSAFGGRSGHEGYFKINSSEPMAGQQLELTVAIRGAESTAAYQLLTTGGAVISGAALTHPYVDRDEHIAIVDVPNQDFVVAVVATAPDGARTNWTSDVFRPRRQFAEFVSYGGAPFIRGQDVVGEIVVGPAPGGSTTEISLVLPTGFSAAQSKWLLLPTTTVTRIPVRIATPTQIPPFTFVEIGVGMKSGATQQRWMHSTHLLAR